MDKPSTSNQQQQHQSMLLNDTIESVNETDPLTAERQRPVSKSDTLTSSQKVKFSRTHVNENDDDDDDDDEDENEKRRRASDVNERRNESDDEKPHDYFLDENGQILRAKLRNEANPKISSLKREHSGCKQQLFFLLFWKREHFFLEF